ncbi:NAD(P)H-dependent oxidoreductase [Marinicellulosiphila megalodicopiae]|uniref:NAD(P)H-dependent oxidoreductase n=1 Tax=Marinicellulosiphila megalodicopiae TaxID=2724896 RepID=UPI003BAF5AFD
MSTVIDDLKWRYATKKMDSSKKVDQEKIDYILEAIRLSATSSGLQPFQVLVITNDEIKKQIHPHAWSQDPIVDCSHLIVFAAWDNYTEARINEMFDLVNEERGFKNEGWENYRQMLLANYVPRDKEVNYQHAARQAYIGLGSALIAAAQQKVDCTPMEGFDPIKVDEILALEEKGLRSVVLLPVGYRAEEGDWLNGLKKVRRATENFVIEIK